MYPILSPILLHIRDKLKYLKFNESPLMKCMIMNCKI